MSRASKVTSSPSTVPRLVVSARTVGSRSALLEILPTENPSDAPKPSPSAIAVTVPTARTTTFPSAKTCAPSPRYASTLGFAVAKLDMPTPPARTPTPIMLAFEYGFEVRVASTLTSFRVSTRVGLPTASAAKLPSTGPMNAWTALVSVARVVAPAPERSPMFVEFAVAVGVFVAVAWTFSVPASTVAPSSTNAWVVSDSVASASTSLIWIAPIAVPVVCAMEDAVEVARTVAVLEVSETRAPLPMKACVRCVTEDVGDSPLPEIAPMFVTLSVAVALRFDVAVIVQRSRLDERVLAIDAHGAAADASGRRHARDRQPGAAHAATEFAVATSVDDAVTETETPVRITNASGPIRLWTTAPDWISASEVPIPTPPSSPIEMIWEVAVARFVPMAVTEKPFVALSTVPSKSAVVPPFSSAVGAFTPPLIRPPPAVFVVAVARLNDVALTASDQSS